ncbi:MAG: carotenoid biosynthesis protein, partial [Ilumatobacteraceae bacterium]
VVTGLAATTTLATARRWSWARTGAGAAVVALGTAAVERIGTSTGWPFGRYRYTGRLRPEVAGVPVVVPLAWWAMAVPAREAAHSALGALGWRSTPVRRVALGAVALTAWDLFLDPQMTAEGYWRWARGGSYRGIPLSNYAGWLLTSAAVMATLEALLPAAEPDRALVGEYAAMGVMETVGFAAFFGDRLVAAVGGLAMVPLAAAAVAGVVRSGDG